MLSYVSEMLKITQLKPGSLIEIENKPYLVLTSSHQILGRGHGMTTAKLKNLETGSQTEKVFRGEETIKEANLIKTKAAFLYNDRENFYFMDNQSFEQFHLSGILIGFAKNFLKEGQEGEILFFKNQPVSINLPIKIGLRVKETEPGLRGGRETPGTKKAILETGYVLQVPLFIKEGDKILVDTKDGSYIERVK